LSFGARASHYRLNLPDYRARHNTALLQICWLGAGPYQSRSSLERQPMAGGRADRSGTTGELPEQPDGAPPFGAFGYENNAVFAVAADVRGSLFQQPDKSEPPHVGCYEF